MSIFYEKYVALCAKRKISLSRAAEEMGFSRTSPNGWKKERIPTKANLARIAEYFGVPVSYFDDSSRVEPFKYDPQLFAEDKPINQTLYETAQVRVLIDTFLKLDEIKKAKLLVYASELAQQ